MDTRREHGQYWPAHRTDAGGETPAGTDNGKVDRVDLGTLPADATASEMRTAIRNIQNAMRPLATAIAAALCGFAMAQTAAWDSLRGGAHVVTNEQDTAAMAAIATATNALHTSLAPTISAASTALQPAATNGIPESIAGHETRIGALEESAADRPDMSLYALRAEVPQAVDLAPYATTTDVVNSISAAASATALQIETLSRNTASAIAASTNGLPERIASSTNALHTSLASTISAASTALQPAATNGLPERIASSTNALHTSLAPTISAASTALQPAATNNIPETLATHADELARLSQALAANTESNTAYRLMSPEGDIYQDATGAVWRVAYATNLSPWHVSVVAYTNGTTTATNEIPGVATWNISGPVDVGEGHWEWYLHIPAGGNVYAEGQTLGQEGQEINFYIGAGEVQSADFERTNIVTRYWTPHDQVLYESSGVSGGLTTNEVCAIVTNTITGFTDWTFSPPTNATEEIARYLFDYEGGNQWLLGALNENGEAVFMLFADGGPDATSLNFGSSYTATRTFMPPRNALGIAMRDDLPPLTNDIPATYQTKLPYPTNAIPYSVITNAPSAGLTTNDVCAIVTNETEIGFSDWHIEIDQSGAWRMAVVGGEGAYWNLQREVSPGIWQSDSDPKGFSYSTTLSWINGVDALFTATATRTPITRNALGLARLDDIPSTNGLATSSQVASATNVIATQMAEYAQNTYAASKAYADAKEYSNYYIVTNYAIDGSGTTITNDMGELITGMAFDLYLTNSLYFIDSYEIPTFKFFAPHRRHAYLGNDFSCVEIGDSRQFLKTYNVQVDGAMAIPDPSHIRFMSTLDRNAPYDQGVAMSLQDYLDAFNPVLVPQTIAMYQTNRADFSIGNIMVHGEIGAAYAEENNYRSNPLLFHVSETNFNYGDVFSVKPHFDNAVEELTNSYGQVTNHYSYVQANANIRTVGLWDLRGDMAVSELSITDKLYVPGFDDIVMAGFYTSRDTNGKIKIEKGVPNYMNMAGPGTSFRQATIRDYMDTIVEPFVAATNIYQQGGVVKEVHSLKPVENATGSGITSQPEGVALQGDNNNRELLLRTNNRTTYHYNGSAVDSSNFNASSAETVSNLVVRFSHPYGYTNESSHLEVRLVVDMSTCAHMLNINIGRENFSSFGNGIWDTILSTTEPDIRTEQIVHTETSVWYDWIYDETIGDWVEDTENPHETTEEWYDEYQTDMTFVVEPYACKEFYFKQVGDKTVRVEIMPLYKTNPTSN